MLIYFWLLSRNLEHYSYTFVWSVWTISALSLFHFSFDTGKAAFSEIENQNIRDFVFERKANIKFFNTIHSYSQLVSSLCVLPHSVANKFRDLTLVQYHDVQYKVCFSLNTLFVCLPLVSIWDDFSMFNFFPFAWWHSIQYVRVAGEMKPGV